MIWELNRQFVLTSARDALEPVFTDPCCWLIINSVHVLAIRLRMMEEDEDPYACLQAFLQVMTQHDFIDNSRTGNDPQVDQTGPDAGEACSGTESKEEKPVSDSLMREMENDDFDCDE